MPIPEVKAKARAKEYIRQEYNATKTIESLEPSKSHNVAKQTGHRMLANVAFKNALQEEMEKQGINDEFITKTLKRNINQLKNIPASNQAIDIHNKIQGVYAPERKETINLNINIKDPNAVNSRINDIKQELQELE